MFDAAPLIDAHFYLGASDSDLAVFDPARRQYIRVEFDERNCGMITSPEGNKGFNINVREQLGIAFTSLILAPSTTTSQTNQVAHIRVWSDITSAVAWTNKLSSRNQLSQKLNRTIRLVEAMHNFQVSASHLPEAIDVMADTESQATSETFKSQWTNLSLMWSQVPMPANIRQIYMQSSTIYKPTCWPHQRSPSMKQPGGSGTTGADSAAARLGYRSVAASTRSNLCSLSSSAGLAKSAVDPHRQTVPPPCCPRLATYHSIISARADTPSASTMAAN